MTTLNECIFTSFMLFGIVIVFVLFCLNAFALHDMCCVFVHIKSTKNDKNDDETSSEQHHKSNMHAVFHFCFMLYMYF